MKKALVVTLLGVGCLLSGAWTVAPLPPCTGDNPHYRELIDVFLANPQFETIRQNVGVAGIVPGSLQPVTNKNVCNSLRAQLTDDVDVDGGGMTHEVYFFSSSNRLFMLIAPKPNQTEVILEAPILYVFTLQYEKLGTVIL